MNCTYKPAACLLLAGLALPAAADEPDPLATAMAHFFQPVFRIIDSPVRTTPR